MIVVDASASVDALIDAPSGRAVRQALGQADALAAPALLTVEATSALWRLVRVGALSEGDASLALRSLAALPIEFVLHQQLVDSAWGHRQRIRINDGFYVALAQHLRAPLLTTDQRLVRSDPGVPIVPLT